MKHPRVSVVVPIYNVEPYLKKCVESLLSQALDQALSAGIDPAELHQMLDLLADASREGI